MSTYTIVNRDGELEVRRFQLPPLDPTPLPADVADLDMDYVLVEVNFYTDAGRFIGAMDGPWPEMPPEILAVYMANQGVFDTALGVLVGGVRCDLWCREKEQEA